MNNTARVGDPEKNIMWLESGPAVRDVFDFFLSEIIF